MNHSSDRNGRASGIGINYGVTAGTITGAVQNTPFAHGGTQINHAPQTPECGPDTAELLRSALTRADTVRHELIPRAEAGDRDALIAVNDLADVIARLTPGLAALYEDTGVVGNAAALRAAYTRFTNRCAVLTDPPPGLAALNAAVTPLTAD